MALARQRYMVKLGALAIVATLALAGCNDPGGGINPDGAGPTRSTGAPFGVDEGEVESPNSLPVGDTTNNAVTSGNGVIGVLHLPP